ncbi:MAG: NAD(P)/FAD-dependent oxidoreductase [Rhizobacter sp.]
MNQGIEALPGACDVLVVGAGPAGSAAAATLARAGLDVVLVDAQAFPRDKVCGDGLIPDAHHAMQKLGVLDEVMTRAQRSSHLVCVGPRGGRVRVPGTLAVLQRRVLDDVLCRAAVAAGARMFAPVRFVGLIEGEAEGKGNEGKDTKDKDRGKRDGNSDGTSDGVRILDRVGVGVGKGSGKGSGKRQPGELPRVVGARLQRERVTREVACDWVVLATGAVPQALLAAGVCERRTPSAIALRGYVRNPSAASRITDLEVLWHPRLKPGYGWIFPCRDGVYNVGVGVVHSHAKGHGKANSMQDVNLRESFKAFVEVYEPARRLVDGGEWVGDLKGAPLRCSLEGARLARPGLLVTGEAAGSTYAFTGEGIGKALETGILAAEAVIQGRRALSSEDEVRAAYESNVLALKPRYEVYERANTVNAHPWLVDLLAWSARRSPSRLKRMSGVLEETHTPGNLLSWGSWVRLLFERG